MSMMLSDEDGPPCPRCGCDGSCDDNKRPEGLKKDATPFPDPNAPEPNVYKVQRFVDRLYSILDGDEEIQDGMADEMLSKFLREMGWVELADLWNEVRRM